LAQGIGGGGFGEVGLDQLAEGGGRLVEDGDALVDEELAECGGISADPGWDDDDAPSVEECPPQLPDRGVEGGGVEDGPGVVWAEGEPWLGCAEEACDVGVCDENALWLARGA